MSGVKMSGEKYYSASVSRRSTSKPGGTHPGAQGQKPLDDNTHKDMLMIAKMLHDEDDSRRQEAVTIRGRMTSAERGGTPSLQDR